jgi:chaperone required for assembly of F1-ATPase
MSAWAAKRFWTCASVVATETGFTVQLDARPVRTPGKSLLDVPTRAMATAIAAEWDAQAETVDPRTMPVTRAANSAIEKVTPQRAQVAQMLADYGDADLTCYRADGPGELVARQSDAWDPLLDWAATEFGARLIPVQGVIHMPQSPASLQRLAEPPHAMTAFELTGFHDLVSLSGSLIIGLAATRELLPIRTLWQRSRIDETWQEEQWGADAEATAMAADKKQAFLNAYHFYKMSRINRDA